MTSTPRCRPIALARPRAHLKAIPLLALALMCAAAVFAPASAHAQVSPSSAPTARAAAAAPAHDDGGALESAATKAGDTGRKVAMSLIGLALSVAAVVLAFKRDFKEAAGVLSVGLIAVLLATPAGVSLLRDTVSSLVGLP
ncbi:MAG TPA: hypothetical protein VLJ42_06510 [Solirubrobacteraceae bacterium]|nr:hypothetical protein [Solirubrobacteraceae bacterium]